MRFIYPSFLWALLFTAIPIIIHLVNLRRHQTVYFSNVNFLKKVKKETQRKSKLKQLLILCSRDIGHYRSCYCICEALHSNRYFRETILEQYLMHLHWQLIQYECRRIWWKAIEVLNKKQIQLSMPANQIQNLPSKRII